MFDSGEQIKYNKPMSNKVSVAFFSNENVDISYALNNLLEELIEYLIDRKKVQNFVLFSENKIDNYCYKIIVDYKSIFKNVFTTGIVRDRCQKENFKIIYDYIKVVESDSNYSKEIIDSVEYCVFIDNENKDDDKLKYLYQYSTAKNKKIFQILE